eukprot:m.57034 g.57034  ORF g.57034 m.57034 type:complete len:62 (+) comp11211_c0_seq1:900-1085(+)
MGGSRMAAAVAVSATEMREKIHTRIVAMVLFATNEYIYKGSKQQERNKSNHLRMIGRKRNE